MRQLQGACRFLADQAGNWARRQHSDLWKLLLISYFISLGFIQVLKPFCAGESHGLPSNSLLAGIYPCKGSLLKQTWVLLMNPYAFWRDLALLKLSEKWTTVETYFLLPRIACALFLPRRAYESAAPTLAAIHRGLGHVALVVLSFITAQRPSQLTIWGMRTWPFMDIGFNSMFPTSPLVEAVYGVVSLTSMLVLCVRYQHMFPDMAVQMPVRLVTCVTSTAWLVMSEMYRRRTSKQRRMKQASLQEAEAAVVAASAAAAAASEAGTSRRDQRAASCSTVVGVQTLSAALRPPAHALPDQQHKPYKARLPVRYFSIHVKIGNAEPEQIAPGYRGRIEGVLAAAGLSLADLYIRHGCLELTVDARMEITVSGAEAGGEEDGSGSGGAAAGDCDVDIGALIRALRLDGQEDDDDEEGGAAGEQKTLLFQGHTTETVLSEPGSADDASSGSLSSSATGFGSDDLSEPRLLATQCHSWSARQGSDDLNVPRITGVHPRVVAVPRQPPSAEAEAQPAAPDTSTAAEAAAVGQPPSANIVLSVAWPASYSGAFDGRLASRGDGVGSRELVLRSQGLYLPVSVDYSDGSAAAGSGARHGGDGEIEDACPSGRADSSAAPDVAPRQGYVYNVQVAGLPPCTGLMLAEARLDGRTCSRPVPVLIVDDPRVAEELVPALMDWGGTSDELDALLVDLGTFLSQATAAARQQQQQQQTSAHQAAPPCGGAGTSVAGSINSLHVWRLVRMGRHLLEYAQACNWARTVERLRADLDQLCPSLSTELSSSGSSASSAAPVPMSAGQEIEPCKQATEAVDHTSAPGPVAERLPLAACTSPGSSGLGGACPPAGAADSPGQPGGVAAREEEEKEEQREGAGRGGGTPAGLLERSTAALQMQLLLLELGLLVALPRLYRHSGQQAGATAGWVAAAALVCCSGAAAGVCSLRICSRRMESLLRRSAQPRLALYPLVRCLQRLLGLAAAPALRAFELGAALVVVEGILRPAFLMVEPRAAARIEALKFLLYLLTWAPSLAPWSAIARAAVVGALSVGTSQVCARLRRRSQGASRTAPRRA